MSPPSKRLVGSVAGVALTLAAAIATRWEGVRYTPYRDPVGVLTVCYGHTGPDVVPGRTYSRAECEALLQHDLAIARAAVHRCIPVPLLPQIDGALTDAAFNLGPRVVCGSTLQKKALANDWPGACAQLDLWNKAGGRVYDGLVYRRDDERALCEGRALWPKAA